MRAPETGGNILDIELGAFGDSARDKCIEGKSQRIRHDTTERANSQAYQINAIRAGFFGLVEGQVQGAIHNGQFVHAAPKANRNALLNQQRNLTY